ncbi:helix-hairpin-helix domain-containing protein [uncultured Eubacterium sp.]|uniref:helix-hairpin-helix domain-containing protein n=1 Tax=uncultured Eubacterium sp. TaxID=165185 RepID=UPI0025E66A5B|nr:helix-hairpin-helix domain-containing protein [uncultured Eubacterium sp.]
MVNKYGRDGHRSRIREAYLANGVDNMDDVHIVELFLSLIIPRKDVKPIAYSLFNRFGSIRKMFSADYEELIEVDGVGKSTAVSILMYNDLMKRVSTSPSINLHDKDKRLDFAKNHNSDGEKYMVVFVSGDGDFMGSISFSCLDDKAKSRVIESIVNYNSFALFVVRYGSENFFGDDINFISELKLLVHPLGVAFLDYVAVGAEKSISIDDTVHYKLIEK